MIRIVKAEVSDARDNKLVRRCIFTSAYAFTGWVDDEVACIVGIISPTVLSNQAYLWLHCTPLVEQHKFLFVRYSQRWLEWAKEEFPVITGHAVISNISGIRWLRRHLGAEFGEPDGNLVPFQIRRA